MNKTRSLVFIGLLISLEIILTRYLSIQTPIVRIGLGFIPLALTAIFYGPVVGGLAAMLSDILGMMIFPKGTYFPGFTFSALLTGVTYGLFLYRKPKSYINVSIAVLLIVAFIDLGLNTLWLSMLFGKAFLVILPTRIISNAIMLPVKIVMISIIWRSVGTYIEHQYFVNEK